MNKKQLTSLALGALILVVLGSVYFFSRNASAEVVARVGNEDITRQELDVRVRQLTVRGALNGFTTPEAAIPDRAIDTLIDESLVYQDAIRNGFSADPDEVEKRYQAAREGFDSEEAFLSKMEENLLTPELFRKNIARQIVIISYLEEVKRQKVQEELDKLPPQVTEEGTSVTITAERVPLTQEEINLLSEELAAQLRTEFEVEVFLN